MTIRRPIVSNGLIAWLPLDFTGVPLYDRSGYGHDISKSTFDSSGGNGYSQDITGRLFLGGRGELWTWNPAYGSGSPADGFVIYTQNPVINVAGDFSIAFWLNSSSSTGSASTATTSDNNPFICSKFAGASASNTARRFRVNYRGASSGLIQFTIGGTSANVMEESVTAVGDGAWHHVACTRDVSSGLTSIYIDGISDASSTLVAGHSSYNTNDFAVGGPQAGETGSGTAIDGKLCNFMFFNRLLSAGEVYSLYDPRTAFRGILREKSPANYFPVTALLAGNIQSPPTPTYDIVNVMEG